MSDSSPPRPRSPALERRTVLIAVGTALSLPSISGCLTDGRTEPPGRDGESDPGTDTSNGGGGPSGGTGSDDGTGTDDGTGSDDSAPSIDDSKGPVRGESDVDLDVREDEDRDEDEVEYLEDEDAVRYVAARRHTNQTEIEGGEPPEREPVYETTPFEDWANTQCVSAAASAAADHVNEELDTDEVGGGITSAVEGEGVVAHVSVTTVLDREGNVVSDTDVDFDALVAATPETVASTYVLEDREFERDVPVYASYDVIQQE